MEVIQQQMFESKKNESESALVKVKRLSKEYGFNARILQGSLTEGVVKKNGSIDQK